MLPALGVSGLPPLFAPSDQSEAVGAAIAAPFTLLGISGGDIALNGNVIPELELAFHSVLDANVWV